MNALIRSSLLLASVISLSVPVRAQTADPLEVPLGPPRRPELLRDLGTKARIESAEQSLRARRLNRWLRISQMASSPQYSGLHWAGCPG